MYALRTVFASTMVQIFLAGCGRSADAPLPKIAERADVIITVDAKRHACVVALYQEPHGSAVPCGDAVPFLRDELRLQSGAIYDIRSSPDVDEAEMAALGAGLKAAGYRFIGGRSDPFLPPPHKDH
jgi:hypothetical protein